MYSQRSSISSQEPSTFEHTSIHSDPVRFQMTIVDSHSCLNWSLGPYSQVIDELIMLRSAIHGDAHHAKSKWSTNNCPVTLASVVTFCPLNFCDYNHASFLNHYTNHKDQRAWQRDKHKSWTLLVKNHKHTPSSNASRESGAEERLHPDIGACVGLGRSPGLPLHGSGPRVFAWGLILQAPPPAPPP